MQSAPPVECALYCPTVQVTHADAPTSMNAPAAAVYFVCEPTTQSMQSWS